MPNTTKVAVKTTSEVKERQNIYDRFRDVVHTFSDSIALKGDGGKGRTYTYSQVDKIIQSGVPRIQATEESYFALVAENRPEWPIAYLTIVAAGRTVVPLDANLKQSELFNLIRLSGVRTIFTTDKLAGMFSELGPEMRVLSLDDRSERYWLKVLPETPSKAPAPPSDEAALIYTSGTTGDPKAVILTHGNILANLEGIETALRFSREDVFISVLPLHHTFEATCGFLTPLLTGCSIVYARSFKSKEILEDIGTNRATVMCGVPLLFEKMYHAIRRGIQDASPIKRFLFWTTFGISRGAWLVRVKAGRFLFASFRRRAGLGTIRMFVSGGAAMPASVSRFFNLTGFDFLQGYGMTECSPVISVNKPDDNRFGSVGPPLGNIEVRIDNPDSGGVGEICVRSGSITPGYKGNPTRTAELIRDGWLYTGDLGRLHKGHIWITGRAKNVIVSAAGKNIYPEELEERLLESRYVLEAIVMGKSKGGGKQGEDVFALIVPDLEQIQVDEKLTIATVDHDIVKNRVREAVADVNARLADFKRITGFEISASELEKTAAKKVKRHIYRQPPHTPPSK